jgi:hypothetical protein
MATLDHIRCRLECSSKSEYRAESNKVLACYGCNQKRGRETWMAFKPWITDAQLRAKWDNRIWTAPEGVDIFAAPSWEVFG